MCILEKFYGVIFLFSRFDWSVFVRQLVAKHMKEIITDKFLLETFSRFRILFLFQEFLMTQFCFFVCTLFNVPNLAQAFSVTYPYSDDSPLL
jgi:hypothetical protein